MRLFKNCDFDPLSGLALAGGVMSAAGTLMGGAASAQMGRMQQQQYEFQAAQERENAAAEIATAGRKSLDTQMRANLLRSSAVAGAAAGGVTTTGGSPLTNEAMIAARGKYAASLDMWNGENAATGDLNKAIAAHYAGQLAEQGGEMAQTASYFSAAGTLASGGASAYKMYGMSKGAFAPVGSGLGGNPNSAYYPDYG